MSKTLLLFAVLLASTVGLTGCEINFGGGVGDNDLGPGYSAMQSFETNSDRLFGGTFFIERDASVICLTPEKLTGIASERSNNRDMVVIRCNRAVIRAPKKNHVYMTTEEKIIRVVPFAEIGLSEIPLPNNHLDIRQYKIACQNYIDKCIEKLKMYLETHGDEIFGETPAEEPGTEAEDE